MRSVLSTALLAVFLFAATATAFLPHIQDFTDAALRKLHRDRPNKHRHEAFEAKASYNASCSIGVTVAQVTLYYSYPYLATSSKSTDKYALQAKICSDGSAAAINRLLLPYAPYCQDSTSSTLLKAARECDVRSKCWTASAAAQGAEVSACFATITNTSDFSAEGKAAAIAACAADKVTACKKLIVNYMAKYSDCVGDLYSSTKVTAIQAASLLDFYCSKPAGMSEICAINLKAISKASGCTTSFNCDPNSWCEASKSSGYCNLVLNSSRMDTLCSPCFSGLIAHAAGLGGDELMMSSTYDYYCTRAIPNNVNSSYCYGSYASSVYYDYYSSSSSVSATCASDGGRCLPRMMTAVAGLLTSSAVSTFNSCVRSPYVGSSFADCVASYVSTLQTGAVLRSRANLVCAVNEQGNWCLPSYWTFANSGCFSNAVSGSCSSSCNNTLQSYVASAGCCLPLINDYLRVNGKYNATYLPSGLQTVTSWNGTFNFNFTAMYAQATLDRSQQPMNAVGRCYNTSALWTTVEGQCPASANATMRSFPIAFAWKVLSANPGKLQRMLASMKADMAVTMGVSADKIRNDSFAENTKVQVGASSRRATASSGVTYTFYVDAGSDTSTAVSAFDTANANGALRLTSTAQTVQQDCSDCVDASAGSSPIAAVNAGVAAATTLAPGATAVPPTPTLPPASPSSAVRPGVLATAVAFASAIAAMLL